MSSYFVFILTCTALMAFFSGWVVSEIRSFWVSGGRKRISAIREQDPEISKLIVLLSEVNDPQRYGWLRSELDLCQEKGSREAAKHLQLVFHEIERALVIEGPPVSKRQWTEEEFLSHIRNGHSALGAKDADLGLMAWFRKSRVERLIAIRDDVLNGVKQSAKEIMGDRLFSVLNVSEESKSAPGDPLEEMRSILLRFNVNIAASLGKDVAQNLFDRAHKRVNEKFYLLYYPEIIRAFPDGVLEAEKKKLITKLELQKEIEQRTRSLSEARMFAQNILNSLSEGFLVFGADGVCFPEFSKSCCTLLEEAPAGKSIADALRVPEAEKDTFSKWCGFLFQEPMPFDDLRALGPANFPHSEGRHIKLTYHSMRREDGEVKGVIVVATDFTNERQAEMDAQRDRAFAKRVVKLVRDRDQFVVFVKEARAGIAAALAELSSPQGTAPDIDSIFRFMHTIKGVAASFYLSEIVEISHRNETILSAMSVASRADRDAAIFKLHEGILSLANQLEQFLIEHRSIIGPAIDAGERRVDLPAAQLRTFSARLRQVPGAEELSRDFVKTFLMEPLTKLAGYFGEIVEDVARKSGKRVNPLEFHGGDIQINQEPYAELFSALTHAFRNAVDHGIEPTKERVAAGKPPEGTVKLECSRITVRDVDWLTLRVVDDGKGVDPSRIRAKLRSQGKTLLSESETDQQIIQHVFDPGLSTAEALTEFSGRGVGMDAIHCAVKKLGGEARIFSTPGNGTILEVCFPLSSLS